MNGRKSQYCIMCVFCLSSKSQMQPKSSTRGLEKHNSNGLFDTLSLYIVRIINR